MVILNKLVVAVELPVLLDQIPLRLDWEGIKEIEDGERGGWRLIEGRLLFEEIRYLLFNWF